MPLQQVASGLGACALASRRLAPPCQQVARPAAGGRSSVRSPADTATEQSKDFGCLTDWAVSSQIGLWRGFRVESFCLICCYISFWQSLTLSADQFILSPAKFLFDDFL